MKGKLRCQFFRAVNVSWGRVWTSHFAVGWLANNLVALSFLWGPNTGLSRQLLIMNSFARPICSTCTVIKKQFIAKGSINIFSSRENWPSMRLSSEPPNSSENSDCNKPVCTGNGFLKCISKYILSGVGQIPLFLLCPSTIDTLKDLFCLAARLFFDIWICIQGLSLNCICWTERNHTFIYVLWLHPLPRWHVRGSRSKCDGYVFKDSFSNTFNGEKSECSNRCASISYRVNAPHVRQF